MQYTPILSIIVKAIVSFLFFNENFQQKYRPRKQEKKPAKPFQATLSIPSTLGVRQNMKWTIRRTGGCFPGMGRTRRKMSAQKNESRKFCVQPSRTNGTLFAELRRRDWTDWMVDGLVRPEFDYDGKDLLACGEKQPPGKGGSVWVLFFHLLPSFAWERGREEERPFRWG